MSSAAKEYKAKALKKRNRSTAQGCTIGVENVVEQGGVFKTLWSL